MIDAGQILKERVSALITTIVVLNWKRDAYLKTAVRLIATGQFDAAKDQIAAYDDIMGPCVHLQMRSQWAALKDQFSLFETWVREYMGHFEIQQVTSLGDEIMRAKGKKPSDRTGDWRTTTNLEDSIHHRRITDALNNAFSAGLGAPEFLILARDVAARYKQDADSYDEDNGYLKLYNILARTINEWDHTDSTGQLGADCDHTTIDCECSETPDVPEEPEYVPALHGDNTYEWNCGCRARQDGVVVVRCKRAIALYRAAEKLNNVELIATYARHFNIACS